MSRRTPGRKGKLTVSVDASALDNQMRVFRSVANMLMVALMVSGGIIGTAIASSSLQDSDSWMARYAELAFFGSLGLATALVVLHTFRFFRRGPDDRR